MGQGGVCFLVEDEGDVEVLNCRSMMWVIFAVEMIVEGHCVGLL